MAKTPAEKGTDATTKNGAEAKAPTMVEGFVLAPRGMLVYDPAHPKDASKATHYPRDITKTVKIPERVAVSARKKDLFKPGTTPPGAKPAAE